MAVVRDERESGRGARLRLPGNPFGARSRLSACFVGVGVGMFLLAASGRETFFLARVVRRFGGLGVGPGGSSGSGVRGGGSARGGLSGGVKGGGG